MMWTVLTFVCGVFVGLVAGLVVGIHSPEDR